MCYMTKETDKGYRGQKAGRRWRMGRQLLLLFFVMGFAMLSKAAVHAQTVDVQLHNDDEAQFDIKMGDTGQIAPVFDGLTDSYGLPVDTSKLLVYYSLYPSYAYEESMYGWSEDYDEIWNEDNEDESSRTKLSLTQTGVYEALMTGNATVYVYGYLPTQNQFLETPYTTAEQCYKDGISPLFSASCEFNITIDTSSLSIAKKQITILSRDEYGYAYASTDIEISSGLPQTLSTYDPEMSCQYDNKKKINLDCSLEDNVLHVYASVISKKTREKCTLHLTIEDKEFDIAITIRILSINKRGLTLARGKKEQLKIKGLGAADAKKIKWSSSNPKVVSVTKNGKIKCRKKGNAVITAKIGDTMYFGCAVCSVSKRMEKVIKRARYIGKHWKYSQPRRMQKGYYDCSSLVWKAYSAGGKKIGNARSYAPVAADIAKWSKSNGKVISKNYNRKQIDKMKFNPGDLAFGTGAKNGRYMGVYHVEMFTGYAVAYYDEKGKPHLNELWAVRSEGYYGGGKPIYRPYKNF